MESEDNLAELMISVNLDVCGVYPVFITEKLGTAMSEDRFKQNRNWGAKNVLLQRRPGIIVASLGVQFSFPRRHKNNTHQRPPNVVLPSFLLCQLFTDTPTCLSPNSSVTE